jgi:ferrous iron transport protein A
LNIGKEIEKMSTTASQITLDELPVGTDGIIVNIKGEKSTRKRLLDMGLVTGETITTRGVAPLGDPMEFVVKGYQLSLRKHEAREVVVEVADAQEV